MAKHTIKSKIGGTLNSRLLELEGEFINLNPDGSATKTVDVIGPLNIAATVQGAPGTEWTLDVSEGSTQLVSEKSTIGAGITDSITATVTLLSAPSKAKKTKTVKGGSKKAAAGREGSKKRGSKKGGSKKGGSKKSGSKKAGSGKGGAKKGAGKSGRKGGGR